MRVKKLLLLVMFGVLMSPVAHAEIQDLLWRAYAQGNVEQRRTLAECERRMMIIRTKATTAEESRDWSEDRHVQWLLFHRIPAMLVLEREMRSEPQSVYLEALLHMTKALDNSRLTRLLPGLMNGASSTRSRLHVIRTLAELRDAKSLAALERFLEGAGRNTPDELMAEAARGLGLTRDEKYLPLLTRASRLVDSQRAALMLAAARYRCGETEMAEQVMEVLRQEDTDQEDTDPDLKIWALDFFAENAHQESVPLLASLAAGSGDERVARRALQALMLTSGYAVPPAKELLERSREMRVGEVQEQEVEEEAADAVDRAAPDEPTASEREELVETILTWWREHPEMRPSPPRRIGRQEALAKPDESRPF